MGIISNAEASDASTFNKISANLPSDIIIYIFVRLPVKSLVRFKCVSKPICALLSNPKFVKQHLECTTSSKNPNLILKSGRKLFSVDDEDWSKARKLDLQFASSLEDVELSGSCNGLLCVSDHRCNEEIFLYNPLTGVSKKLPFPDFDMPTIEDKCFTTMGFGYHQKEDDYKIVRCVYLYDKPFIDIDSYECEARVYSLKTNKWKKLGEVPYHLGYKVAVLVGDRFLVWKASRGHGRRLTYYVTSFDMNTEEFQVIPQPNYPIYYGQKKMIMDVGVLDGYLSIFYHKENCIDIWTMKDYGKVESWTMKFVIQQPVLLSFSFFVALTILKNGKILIMGGERQRVIYDPRTETYEAVNIQGAPTYLSMTINIGSLVSPFSCCIE